MLTPFQFGLHAEQDVYNLGFAINRGTWRGHDAFRFISGQSDKMSFLDHGFLPEEGDGDTWPRETELTNEPG